MGFEQAVESAQRCADHDHAAVDLKGDIARMSPAKTITATDAQRAVCTPAFVARSARIELHQLSDEDARTR